MIRALQYWWDYLRWRTQLIFLFLMCQGTMWGQQAYDQGEVCTIWISHSSSVTPPLAQTLLNKTNQLALWWDVVVMSTFYTSFLRHAFCFCNHAQDHVLVRQQITAHGPAQIHTLQFKKHYHKGNQKNIFLLKITSQIFKMGKVLLNIIYQLHDLAKAKC